MPRRPPNRLCQDIINMPTCPRLLQSARLAHPADHDGWKYEIRGSRLAAPLHFFFKRSLISTQTRNGCLQTHSGADCNSVLNSAKYAKKMWYRSHPLGHSARLPSKEGMVVSRNSTNTVPEMYRASAAGFRPVGSSAQRRLRGEGTPQSDVCYLVSASFSSR